MPQATMLGTKLTLPLRDPGLKGDHLLAPLLKMARMGSQQVKRSALGK